MLAFILLLVIVAIVLGIVGVTVKGLLWLLFIGIVIFLGGLLFGAWGMRRPPPPRHSSLTGDPGTAVVRTRAALNPAARASLRNPVESRPCAATTRRFWPARISGCFWMSRCRIAARNVTCVSGYGRGSHFRVTKKEHARLSGKLEIFF